MADSTRTRRAFAVDEATAILARTPATLDALLRGLPSLDQPRTKAARRGARSTSSAT